MSNHQLEVLFDQIRELFGLEYHRGGRDAMAALMETAAQKGFAQATAAQPPATSRTRSESQRDRAPRGAPEAFVRRILVAAGTNGVRPAEISPLAETDVERKISDSAIRLQLQRAAKGGWAKNDGKRWYYIEGA